MARSDDNEVELLEVETFDFSSDAGRKEMYSHSCDVVDSEGTATEKRFQAALALGELIQVRRQTSQKSLANVYRYAMDQVLSDFGFTSFDETPLKELLLKYWKHADELREALGELPPEGPQIKKSLVGRGWTKASHGVNDGEESDIQPEPREIDVHQYRFTREAGVR